MVSQWRGRYSWPSPVTRLLVLALRVEPESRAAVDQLAELPAERCQADHDDASFGKIVGTKQGHAWIHKSLTFYARGP